MWASCAKKPLFFLAYACLNLQLGLRCIADTVWHFQLPFSKHQVPYALEPMVIIQTLDRKQAKNPKKSGLFQSVKANI